MNAVINLMQRPDRLARFQDSYAASGWADVLGPVEVFPAVDGARDLPTAWQRFLPGVYGCFRSHLMLIERAFIAQDEALYVFEDDAVFEPDSADRLVSFLHAVPDRNVLWLGGQPLGNTTCGLGWRCARAVMRTHAYSLSRRAMQAIVRPLREAIGHLDGIFIDLLGDFYLPDPQLVGQGAGVSDINGCYQPERWWNR